MGQINRFARSIIIRADVKDLDSLKNLVSQTCDIEGIGGYKLGAILTIPYGLPLLVKTVRQFTDLPIIYDHEKGATDFPDLAEDFISAVKNSGVDALIIFPVMGPATEETWISTANKANLELIVGGEMTHPNYKRSEGGFIADEALDEIYLLAAKHGINNFVVPGNKKERIEYYLGMLKPIVKSKIAFWSPGFGIQGGKIDEIPLSKDFDFHPIVGRAIYAASNIRAAAEKLAMELGVGKG